MNESERANGVYLLAHNRDPNLASVWGAAVLKEKDALPGPELHFPIYNWDRLACPRQNHSDM